MIRVPAPALPRREVLTVPPPGAAWHVAALPTSISSTHNWATAELVLFCSELSKVNRIPLGSSSSIFSCPAWRFPAFILTEFLFVSWRLHRCGPVWACVPGSAALVPDPVGCVAITFLWAAILKVWCSKHFLRKWGTKVQPLPLPRQNCSFPCSPSPHPDKLVLF